MKPVINALRAVLTIVLLLLMFLSWVVALLLQYAAIALMYPFSTKEQRQDVCGYIFRFMNFLVLDLLNPMWSNKNLRPLDRSKLPKGRPIIFMMNHLSNSDPWTCIRLLWPYDCKWICKGSLFSVPVGGWCLTNNGDLAVRFTKEKGGWGTEKGSVKALMDDAAQLLRRGQPIAVFPEGVRNKDGNGLMGEFKVGFFDLAIKEGAIIVPVAISGTHNMWPKGSWMFGFAKGYGTVCDYIETKGLTTEQLVEKTRKAIDAARNSHPDRQKWIKAHPDLYAAQQAAEAKGPTPAPVAAAPASPAEKKSA